MIKTALPFTGSVILNKEVNFSEHQSLHLSNVNKTHLIYERTEDLPGREIVKTKSTWHRIWLVVTDICYY